MWLGLGDKDDSGEIVVASSTAAGGGIRGGIAARTWRRDEAEDRENDSGQTDGCVAAFWFGRSIGAAHPPRDKEGEQGEEEGSQEGVPGRFRVVHCSSGTLNVCERFN